MKSSRASGNQVRKFKKEPKSSYGFKQTIEQDDIDFQNNDKRVHIEFQLGLKLKDDFDLEDWK